MTIIAHFRGYGSRLYFTLTITVTNKIHLYRGLKEYVGSVDANYAQEKEDFFVGFDGSFGSRQDGRIIFSKF